MITATTIRTHMTVSALTVLLLSVVVTVNDSVYAAPPAFRHAAQKYGLPADVLYAIALVESGRSTSAHGKKVWPWTLNVDHRAVYAESDTKAIRVLEASIAEGVAPIAVGIMQVLWSAHAWRFDHDPEKALDPHRNIDVGAWILRENFDASGDLWKAVGLYYAGSLDTPRRKAQADAYRMRVARALVKELGKGNAKQNATFAAR